MSVAIDYILHCNIILPKGLLAPCLIQIGFESELWSVQVAERVSVLVSIA